MKHQGITWALRRWGFRMATETEVVRLVNGDRGTVYAMKGMERAFTPRRIGDVVVVWVRRTSSWWISQEGWRP